MAGFWRRRSHDDFSEEIDAHLDLEADRLVTDGWSRDAAHDAARRAFGNVAIVKERFYETSRWMWIEHIVQDLQYGWRGLRQSPAFLSTTVLTLAVGLGLVTVAFSIFNAYVLRPYAVRDPYGLHRIAWVSRDSGGQSFRWRDYVALSERRDLFDALVAEHTRFVSSQGRPLGVALVSDNYFDTLGPRLVLGRGFDAADRTSGDRAVLSDQTWARLFARDPAALGGAIDVNGRSFTVVGVVAPDFVGLSDSPRDLWISLPAYAAIADPALLGANQPRAIEVTARMRPGVTAEQAASALTAFMNQTVGRTDDVRAEVRVQASANPLSMGMLAILSPVFAAFCLVLITACANVSNVMLARAIARHREIAVRLSLGASRGRVVRQLLTEGLLIALLAALVSLALASWALRAATAIIFSTLPSSVAAIVRVAPVDFDYRVFSFALLAAAATTLLFALLPALQASRLPLVDALHGQGSGAARNTKLRSALVIGQVAVSLVLVIVAVTLARNAAAIGAIDLGYETRGVTSINVRGEGRALVQRLASALASEPGIAEIAATGGNPLFIRSRTIAVGRPESPEATPTRYTFVSPDYFSILRVPIVNGRGFREDEARSAAPVAIVSATTANALWPGEDPVGRVVRIEASNGRPVDDLPAYPHVTVVGMTHDLVSGFLVDGYDPGHIYLPTSFQSERATALLIRGRSDRELAPDQLQQSFRQAAADPEVFEALPLDEMRDLQMYPLRAASWSGGVLAAVALVLSVSGLYGVLTYTLNQRIKEIGIRIALGASPRAVVGLMTGQSVRLAGIGAMIGLAGAFTVMSALSAAIRLQRVSVLDLLAFAGGLVVTLAAAAIAAYQPARRAAGINPAVTLRADG
jgi:putative ABC transport system permease protein